MSALFNATSRSLNACRSSRKFQRKLLAFQSCQLYGTVEKSPASSDQTEIVHFSNRKERLNNFSRKKDPCLRSISYVQQSLQNLNKALSAYRTSMTERQAAIKTARNYVNFVQQAIDGKKRIDSHYITSKTMVNLVSYPMEGVPLNLTIDGIIENQNILLPEISIPNGEGGSSPGTGYCVTSEQLESIITTLSNKSADLENATAAEPVNVPTIPRATMKQVYAEVLEIFKPYVPAGALLRTQLSDDFMQYCKTQKLDVSNVFQAGQLMLQEDHITPQDQVSFLLGKDDSLFDKNLYCFQKADLSNIQEALNKLVANLTSLSDQWTMRVSKLYQTWNFLCQLGSQIQVLGSGITKNAVQNWK